MKKNIVFIPAIDAGRGRHHAYQYSINSWKNWAEKNDAEVLVWDTPLYEWGDMTIPWQRYHLFKILEHNDVNYDQILMVDSDTIVHPNTPNFFKITDRKYCGVLDNGCWEWTGRSLRHYKDLFNNFKLERGLYINGGFQIVNENHKEFFNEVLDFYFKNQDILVKKQKAGLSTDQTPINYLLQIKNVDVNMSLPTSFMLTHLYRFNWFGHNWQIGNDNTPFFLKYGYIWFYSGFPNRGDRYNLMNKTWEVIKEQYR